MRVKKPNIVFTLKRESEHGFNVLQSLRLIVGLTNILIYKIKQDDKTACTIKKCIYLFVYF